MQGTLYRNQKERRPLVKDEADARGATRDQSHQSSYSTTDLIIVNRVSRP